MVCCTNFFGFSATKDGVPFDLLRASAPNEDLLFEERVTADLVCRLAHHAHCHHEGGKYIIPSVQKFG